MICADIDECPTGGRDCDDDCYIDDSYDRHPSAWNDGWQAAKDGQQKEANPYKTPDLRNAWAMGHWTYGIGSESRCVLRG